MARTDFPVLDANGAQVDVAGYDNASVITPATVLEDASGNDLLGQQTMAASLPVTLASDQDFVKAEDSVHGSGDKGIPFLVVRRDSVAAGGANGDYVLLCVDSGGRLWTHVDSLVGITSLGTKAAANSLPVTLASDEVLPDTAAGDLAAIVAALAAQLPASLGQKAKAASLPVTLASDEDIVKAEDAAHSGGDKGVMMLAVRKDTAAALAGTDADYIPLITDATGQLWANVGSLLGLTALGQAAKAGSLPVTLASDEDDINVATGATDDGAAAGEIFPIAGLYDDSSTDEVDEGDVGRLRMSARRAALFDADFQLTEVDAADLNTASLAIDGITFDKLQALKMGSEDGSTYGTTAAIIIPLAVAHWKSAWFAIKNSNPAHDQAIVLTVYTSPQNSTALSNPRGRIAQFTIPTTADLALVVGEGTVGQGGNAGAATASNLAVYACQIPRGTPYIQILLSATAPTAGSFASIEIGRIS